MSVLGFPRLYLRGLMSWDPPVSNNDPDVYDGITARAVLRPGEPPAAMRQRLTATEDDRGDWNYYGSHRAAFAPVSVVGGTTGPGASAAAVDPLLAAPAELTGKLVDLDPAGTVSQLFFDELAIGTAGRPHLRARPVRRMASRWLNFGRNLTPLPIAGSASAAWQGVFRAEDVELLRSDASPLLTAFADLLAAGQVRGLMLRLCTYRTRYYQNGVLNDLPSAANVPELEQLHLRGLLVADPAWSEVVGVLGPWADGESETMVAGRHLVGLPLPQGTMAPGLRVGPVAAELHADAGVLSLDLGSTVPEVDAGLAKLDLGPIDVAVQVGATRTPLGRIERADYDRVAYEARAGIVDLDVSAVADVVGLVAAGALVLSIAGPADLAGERAATVSCDEPTVYLDQGEPRDLVLTVRERGVPPARPLSVLLARYGSDMTLLPGEQTVLPVSADGTVTVSVTGDAPGYRHFGLTVFPAGGAQPAAPPRLSIATAQFVSIRTLPFDDDLAALPDASVTWDLLFSAVLATYHAVTPRMSEIIDLADEDAVRTFARRIRELTSAGLFESARYMPVTRDLSRGRRALLHRWCDLVLGDVPAPAAPPPEEGVAAEPPRRETVDRLPGVPEDVVFSKRAP
jgi:hypothetical protein